MVAMKMNFVNKVFLQDYQCLSDNFGHKLLSMEEFSTNKASGKNSRQEKNCATSLVNTEQVLIYGALADVVLDCSRRWYHYHYVIWEL